MYYISFDTFDKDITVSIVDICTATTAFSLWTYPCKISTDKNNFYTFLLKNSCVVLLAQNEYLHSWHEQVFPKHIFYKVNMNFPGWKYLCEYKIETYSVGERWITIKFVTFHKFMLTKFFSSYTFPISYWVMTTSEWEKKIKTE